MQDEKQSEVQVHISLRINEDLTVPSQVGIYAYMISYL